MDLRLLITEEVTLIIDRAWMHKDLKGVEGWQCTMEYIGMTLSLPMETEDSFLAEALAFKQAFLLAHGSRPRAIEKWTNFLS